MAGLSGVLNIGVLLRSSHTQILISSEAARVIYKSSVVSNSPASFMTGKYLPRKS